MTSPHTMAVVATVVGVEIVIFVGVLVNGVIVMGWEQPARGATDGGWSLVGCWLIITTLL